MWCGLKITTAVADAFASIVVSFTPLGPVIPADVDGVPWIHRPRPRFFILDTIELKEEVHRRRLPAAAPYALRVVRGTPFDPFERTAMRRLERSLIDEYTALIRSIDLDAATIDSAIAGDLP